MLGEPKMTFGSKQELPREELEHRLDEVAERLVELYVLGISGEQLKHRIGELHTDLSRFSGWTKQELHERFIRRYLIYERFIRPALIHETDCQPIAGTPKTACFLLDLFLAKTERATIPGDLAEEFTTSILPTYGARRARLWFWTQTLRTIATRNPVCRWILVEGLARIGEWIFRQIGG
jgi:hypothetical protein